MFRKEPILAVFVFEIKSKKKKINKCSNRIKFWPRRHSGNKHQMFSHFSVIFSLRSELNSYRYRYRIIIFSVPLRSCACIQKQYLKESERSVDSKSSPIAYLLGRSGNSSIGQSDGFVCLYFALSGWSSFSFVREFLFLRARPYNSRNNSWRLNTPTDTHTETETQQ